MYEIVFVLAWEMWSVMMVGLGTYFAMMTWDTLEARIAEAKEGSIGIETALSWQKALKTHVLTMVVGVIVIIAGFVMGDIADEVLTWFDQYADDTSKEGSEVRDYRKVPGTAALQDMFTHSIVSAYAMIIFVVMSLGSFYFAHEFLQTALVDDDFGEKCDLAKVDKSVYSGVKDIVSKFKDRASCEANMDDLFKILDRNNNFLIERCEDASFQYSSGSTKEYALKFSSQFTIEAAKMLCAEDFEI